MRRARLRLALGLAAAALLASLALAALASGLVIRAGELIIHANGGFAPRALPKKQNAPITLHGAGSIATVSGELPPIIRTLTFEFDRHGTVQTTGLPVCTAAQLQATTPTVARHRCPGAIVGEGSGHAVVQFPEQAPIPISSPITLFNGPKKNGDDTVIAHAYTTVPVTTTFVVPIVIERIHDGVFGYRTEARIPPIANGAGVPISASIHVGRHWTYRGHRYSYLNARCETGHLQAKGQFSFDNGTLLSGTFVRRCLVRH